MINQFDALPSTPTEERWREQKTPIPVVVSIICRSMEDSDYYLLIQRNNKPYQGYWALVGGKWDFGETLGKAAVREVREETGLETDFIAFRGLVSERLVPENWKNEKSAHFLIFVCQVEASDGDANEQKEGAVAWFTKEEIESLFKDEAIIPSDYAMLKKFTMSEPIPHFEADMVAAAEGGNDYSGDNLLRFEKII